MGDRDSRGAHDNIYTVAIYNLVMVCSSPPIQQIHIQKFDHKFVWHRAARVWWPHSKVVCASLEMIVLSMRYVHAYWHHCCCCCYYCYCCFRYALMFAISRSPMLRCVDYKRKICYAHSHRMFVSTCHVYSLVLIGTTKRGKYLVKNLTLQHVLNYSNASAVADSRKRATRISKMYLNWFQYPLVNT